MPQMPVTIIISDLHLGGGMPDDPGDDHVCDKNQLVRFIGEIGERRDGPVELFINGDFLEFAQVLPGAYTLDSPDYWCSESESGEKLEAIIRGHRDVFDALAEFQRKGHAVTIAPGNHDVDLYWEGVRRRLREVAGPINFELGRDVYYRYNKRLVIGHGHEHDPANSFGKERWSNPILRAEDGPRLAMCPGTLFIVKFVNWLEHDYPFADNLKPFLTLARLLRSEKPADFQAAGKIFLQFAYEYKRPFLSAESGADDVNVAKAISLELQTNPQFLAEMTALYREAREADAAPETVRRNLDTKDKVLKFLGEMVLRVAPPKWLPLTARFSQSGSLSIIHSSLPWRKEKDILREEAISTYLAQPVYEVVVYGHTHQPDEWRGTRGTWDGGYFNPGSWTRYLDLDKVELAGEGRLTLNDLRKESDYPYQLNYVRVKETAKGTLRADKICFEEGAGARFEPTPAPRSVHVTGGDN